MVAGSVCLASHAMPMPVRFCSCSTTIARKASIPTRWDAPQITRKLSHLHSVPSVIL
jgi:hypothetical protein